MPKKKIFSKKWLIQLKVNSLFKIQVYIKSNLDPQKLDIVSRRVQELAGNGDFEEFCRYMYSVSRFGDEIEFNFIHPQTLLPSISPPFR